MKKKVLSILLALVMVAGIVPFGALPVFAAVPIPQLTPDFDRDGAISISDRDRSLLGTDTFTIWLNDDDDAEGTDNGDNQGDTNSAGNNIPSHELDDKDYDDDIDDKDYDDDIVNGRCDLLDFFPVLVDVQMVDDWQNWTWKIKTTGSANVNVVFTKLSTDTAGSFHTKEVDAFDGDTPLYRAATVSLADEVALPEDFLNKESGKGVLLIEGSGLGEGNIVLEGIKVGSDSLISSLPVNVANVEDMYRTINLRKDGASELTEPLARKDADSDGRQFVFVHGYNVSHNEARGTASDFYKRLWQSGSDSMFTAVEWDSDESMFKYDPLNIMLTPNYYANVENAFAAAEDFKNQCEQLPGRKYLVGHSLGNMLICSAIQDFGLEYEKYFMLNAAIAGEAFDKDAVDDGMIDDYWENYIPVSERASHWYENFGQDSDFRSTITWKGRFEDVKKNVVNLYSPSDEFLANCPDDVNREATAEEIKNTFKSKLFAQKTGYKGYLEYDGFWAFTEKIKGTDYIGVINEYLNYILDAQTYIDCEGGWGVNVNYAPGDSSRANTRFTPFKDKRMAYEEAPTVSCSEAVELKAQLLANAIPAESYATGSNPVSTLANINLESFIGANKDWPSFTQSEETGEKDYFWKHNDVTDIAYYHTSKFYDYIAASPWDRLCAGEELEGEFDVSVSNDVKTIKLLNDITAGSNDAPFCVDNSDIKVILDLNGHSIDVSQAGGSAIVVNYGADLTIIDSSESSGGKITGGTGQTLKNDDSKLYGGGVLVLDGKLTMTGGAVTGNSADFGGGIYVADEGELYIGGTAKIYGNLSKDGTADNNLYLQNNKYITVCTGSDGLKAGAEIGISKTGNGRISSNGAEADAKYFFSDAEGKIISHETDGTDRLELAEAPNISTTVTFDMQEDGGTSETVTARYAYAMPEITLPTRFGYTFEGYYDESGKAYYNASGKSVRNCDRQDDFTLYAHWKNGTYNIMYRDVGGDGFTGEHETGYPTTHTYGSATTLKRAVKKDWFFVGWFREPDCSGDPVTSVSADCAGNIMLYAKWITHKHSYEWNNEVGTNRTHTVVCVNTEGRCDEPIKTVDCSYTKENDYFICSVCGTKEFPHIHSYKWNNEVGTNGAHTLVCANTDGCCEKLTGTEACTYKNGSCSVCGAVEPGKCYINRSWDETKKQVVSSESVIPEDAVKITADTRELTSGWYVLSESVTLPQGAHITVNGDVNLVLCDGCELKIPSPDINCAGIELNDGGTFGTSDSLTVYGQKNGTGSIVAYGGRSAAGIGSGYEDDCGEITICGGTVTATGGERAAGIGNGRDGVGGDITIYGGKVSAYGNGGGMALGGESGTLISDHTKIKIYGGDILADSRSGKDAAVANSFTVYGDSHNRFTVKDADGTALAFSPVTEEKDLYNSLSGNKVLHIELQPVHTFDEYADNGNGTHYGICACGAHGNNESHNFNEETGKCICGVSSDDCLEYRYYDEESGEFKTGCCSEYTVIDKYYPVVWQGGKWYVVNGEVSINQRIVVCKGDGTGVKLILTDGSKLTLTNGISVNKTDNDENTLTIYAQSGGTGMLRAGRSDLDFTHAGIGGNADHDGGTVNIHGGVVTALSRGGAGIGGGGSDMGSGGSGSVNIYGGTVNASSYNFPGIGGTTGCSIKITGGLGSAKTGAGYPVIGCINNPGDYIDIGDDVRFYDSADKPIAPPEGDEWAHQLAGMSYVKFAEADAKPLATPTSHDFSSNGLTSFAYGEQQREEDVNIYNIIYTTKEGMGAITLKYQKINGEVWDENRGNATTAPPTEPGVYRVLISVAGGANYAASDGDITDDSWTFPITVDYIDRRWDEDDKQFISTDEYTTTAKKITADTTELSGGWYIVYGAVTNKNRIVVNGTVQNPTNIILFDGARLDAKSGIEVSEENALNIYGQKNNTGKIAANVNDDLSDFCDCAAIGGNSGMTGGKITVYGGSVTAASANGAGIGGGKNCESHGTLSVVGELTVMAGDNADNAEPVTAEDYRTNRNPYVKIGDRFVKCAVNVAGGTPENCTVTLTDTENTANVYNGEIEGKKTYYVDNVADGIYILTVTADEAVTRTYTVEINGGAVKKSAELYIENDVNGDGVVDANDYSAAVNSALASENAVPEDLTATANYQKAVADFDKDGYVDVIDLVLFERVVSC